MTPSEDLTDVTLGSEKKLSCEKKLFSETNRGLRIECLKTYFTVTNDVAKKFQIIFKR